MEPYQIAIIVIAVIIVIGIIAVALVAARKKAKDKTDSETAGKVNVIDGVRYTESDKISSDGEINVTHNESDLILKKGKTFKAEKNGALMPGKYTVLSSSDGADSFNIRAGGFVREYKHGDSIVIAEGDEVTAVSHTVVLR